MKKIIRIILSIPLFLLVMFGLLVIPFGPACLITGLFNAVILKPLRAEDDGEPIDWVFVFIWFTAPYYFARQFIKDGTIPD